MTASKEDLAGESGQTDLTVKTESTQSGGAPRAAGGGAKPLGGGTKPLGGGAKPPGGGAKPPGGGAKPLGVAAEDPPPNVQGDLSRARQLASEGEQKRLRGDHISAAYKFEEAVAAIPPELAADPASGATALLNWCQAHRAASLGVLGLLDLARPLFSQVLNSNPEYGWALAQYAEALRIDLRDRLSGDPKNKAEFYENAGEALQAFDEVVRLKPTHAWAYAHRGALLLLIYWYATTHALPWRELPERLLGAAIRASGDPQGAFYLAIQRDLAEALRLEPTYGWAKLFQALFQNLFDEHDASRSTLTGILAAGGGNNVTVLSSLAMSHVYAGDLKSAAPYADRILAFDQEHTTAQYVRAKALQRASGDLERRVFESFKTRLQVARDRLDALIEDLNDRTEPRTRLLAKPGASLDNMSIRARLMGVRKLSVNADVPIAPAAMAWPALSRAAAELTE